HEDVTDHHGGVGGDTEHPERHDGNCSHRDDQQHLGQSHQAQTDDLPGEQVPGAHHRQEDLHDPAALLLHHALADGLPQYQDEDVQQKYTHDGHHQPFVCPIGGLIQRSEEHTSELQSRFDLVCLLLL